MAKVSKDEMEFVSKATGAPEKDIYASTAIRLYSCPAESTKFAYTGIYGILSLHLDSRYNAVYLKVTDLNTKKLVLVQECYTEFFSTYSVIEPHFHSFESEAIVFGLCFAEDFDGDRFRRMTSDLIVGTSKLAPTIAPQQLSPRNSAKEKDGKPLGKNESGTGGFFGWFGKKEKNEGTPPKPKLSISAPRDVIHVSGFGNYFGENEGKIPDDWVDVLKKAGLTEKEMKNEKVVEYVVGTIMADKDTHQKIKEEAKAGPPKAPPKRPQRTEQKVEAPETVEAQPEKKSAPKPPGPPGPPPPGPPPPPTGGIVSKPIKTESGIENEAPRPKKEPPSGERGDLLSSIQKGTQLKKVDLTDRIKKMDETEKNDLAATIAAALKIRREVVDSDDDEDNKGDDW